MAIERRIAGAVLDVYEERPLALGDPRLLDFDNVVLTRMDMIAHAPERALSIAISIPFMPTHCPSPLSPSTTADVAVSRTIRTDLRQRIHDRP